MQQNSRPLVSIIIPSYNYGRFLAQTLDSVLRQTYTNWECIIVDDGSKDNSGEIAAEYEKKDKRIRYIYQDNQGIATTRNTGLKNMNGDYVQYLDADDMLPPQKIEMQLAIFEKNKDVDIVYGLFFTDRDGQESKTHKLKTSGQGDLMIQRLCINNFVDTAAPLIKRSAIDKIGLFDPIYEAYEDWEYWFRAAVLGIKFLYCPGEGMDYYYRYGHTSFMTNHRRFVLGGIRLRKHMATQPLKPVWKLYNFYRLIKLVAKKTIYRW
jgi:glycosyltransferase involved in cell wall biosynthesis